MNYEDYPWSDPIGFAAGPLDRCAELRQDAAALARLRTDPQSRHVPLWRYRVAADQSRACLLRSGQFPDTAPAVFLGCDGEGRAYFSTDLSALDEDAARALVAPGWFVDLRMSAPGLEDQDRAILAYARAMVWWQRQHRHCGRCGAPTTPDLGGHVLRCAPCEVEHYPRSDPSMLVLVSADERCLLGRQAAWPKQVWSTLAGFVEPGESLEDAVLREVWEEARIQITALRYFGSQPWPFPGSVLAGFHASGIADTPQVEQDELEAADWFSRAQIAAGVEAGTLWLPPPVTLSFRLIEHWFDQQWTAPLRSMVKPFGPRS